MAESKRQKTKKHASASPGSPKVELDRIELPPETLEVPVPDPPAENEAPKEKPPADLQPAMPPDTPKEGETTPHDTQKLPGAVRFFLITIAGIAAAVWILTGILYLFDWLSSR